MRKKRKNKVEKGQVAVNVVEERAGEWLDEQTLKNGEAQVSWLLVSRSFAFRWFDDIIIL